jgi:dTDP-4-dehydrorhamnose reductase
MEVAKELVNVLGLTEQVKMTEVNSDYFKDIYFAPRPPCERLVNKKLDLRGINIMRDWREALKDYIDLYFKDYLKDKF